MPIANPAANDSFAGGLGRDNFIVNTAAHFAAADTLQGGSDLDALVFNVAMNIVSGDWDNKTGIERLIFNANSSVNLPSSYLTGLDLSRLYVEYGSNTLTLGGIGGFATNNLYLAGTGAITISNGITSSYGFSVDPSFTGNASIFGGAQSGGVVESIVGGNGNDFIDGGDGNDNIKGDNGNDTLYGGNGIDTFTGEPGDGNDLIYGGAGNDVFGISAAGNDGQDTLYGDDGNDSFNFVVSTAAKQIFGGAGADTVSGSSGNDTIDGGADNDSLAGGNGNDWIFGGSGNDTLSGSNGNDTLDGGSGVDLMTGGANADVFVFSFAATASDTDTVTDFTSAGGAGTCDQIQINGFPTGLGDLRGTGIDLLVNDLSQASTNLTSNVGMVVANNVTAGWTNANIVTAISGIANDAIVAGDIFFLVISDGTAARILRVTNNADTVINASDNFTTIAILNGVTHTQLATWNTDHFVDW